MPLITGLTRVTYCLFSLLLLITPSSLAATYELHEVKFKVQGVLNSADGKPVAGAELLLLLENPEKPGKEKITRRLMMQRMKWQNDPTKQPDAAKLATLITPGISGPSGYFSAETSRRYENHSSWFTDWFSSRKHPFTQAWLVVWKDGRLLKPIPLDCSAWKQMPDVEDLKLLKIPLESW